MLAEIAGESYPVIRVYQPIEGVVNHWVSSGGIRDEMERGPLSQRPYDERVKRKRRRRSAPEKT